MIMVGPNISGKQHQVMIHSERANPENGAADRIPSPEMISDEQKRALEEAFGPSSSDDDEAILHLLDSRRNRDEVPPVWESVPQINGLWLCRRFLSGDLQDLLLSSIQREGWFSGDSYNQAMRFGDLPEWANELARCVREAVCFSGVEEGYPLPMDLLRREPLFDQLIVNVYQPGEGICAHIDLMRFEDGIAIVSLESTCVMHFTRSKPEIENAETEEIKEDASLKVPVLLNPGSLVLMSGEARYLWKHEINRKPGFQLWEGKEIHQDSRTSVTLRKLGPSTNSC